MTKPSRPHAHDRLRIATHAAVHPRTVDRCYASLPVRSTVAARVLAACRALALPEPVIVIAPASAGVFPRR
jgi:hypothetical protein